MSPELAERVAALEAERLRPVPPVPVAESARRKLARLAATAPVSEADQARHRKELLDAIRGA